jgi:hypothetical protein
VSGLDRLDALDKVTRHLESEVAALRDRIRILEAEVTATRMPVPVDRILFDVPPVGDPS